jgi:mannose-6-phosphate isomerase-like protein (cupin superfamily)
MDSTVETRGTRVVVTGHNSEGNGVVVEDRVAESHERRAAGYEFQMLWGADTLPSYPDDGRQATYASVLPPVGGIRFAVLLVEPDSESQQALEDVELEGLRRSSEPGSRVHATATVDLLTVIEGEVWLELDNGRQVHLRAGDCAVQNGTRHAWHNYGDKTTKVAVALVGVNNLTAAHG